MVSHKSKENLIIRKVNQKVGKAIQKYHLIDEGDRILVGLSGGKDSMVLLETLAGRLKFHPVKYELAAIHVSLKSQPYSVDLEYLKSFAQSLAVPFIHKIIDVDLFGQKMFEGNLSVIRPLMLLTENEIMQFAAIRNFKHEIKLCTFEKESKRKDIKNIITQLAALHPNARTNIYASMTNILEEYLPGDKY